MLMRQAMLGAMVVVGGLSADDRISQTEKGSVLIEKNWTNINVKGVSAYTKSKTIAEMEAWSFVI